LLTTVLLIETPNSGTSKNDLDFLVRRYISDKNFRKDPIGFSRDMIPIVEKKLYLAVLKNPSQILHPHPEADDSNI